MKILIADDERMVRLGLINMLEELYPSKHEFTQVKNGKEMLEHAEKEKSDIAFVDIKMPLVDGLSALEKYRDLCPDTVCFILSGYSDFEYARTALNLGVVKYLLKPVSRDILKKAVDTAYKSINLKAEEENLQFANWASSILFHKGENCDSLPPGKFSLFKVQFFYVDIADPQTRFDVSKELKTQINNKLNGLIQQGLRYAILPGKAGEVFLITEEETTKSPCLKGLLPSVTCTEAEDVPLKELFNHCNNLLRTHADTMLLTTKTKGAEYNINWVKKYIDENYMNEISITSIASLMQISPNYLSTIFHKQVGEKFIDYLTRTRMTNAKQILLESPRITVNEVAKKVGYISTRHFTATFTKYVGCLPSEYIKKRQERVL